MHMQTKSAISHRLNNGTYFTSPFLSTSGDFLDASSPGYPPSGQVVFIQRLINIDATSTALMRQCLNVACPLCTIHYENTPIQIYCKLHLQKTENFQMKNSDIFHISAQNIDCGYSLEPPRRGGSNEYPQSMFSSRNKKNNAYPSKPQFYYIKVGFKWVKII